MAYKKHCFNTIAKGPAGIGLGYLIVTDVKQCSCGRMAVEYNNSGKLQTEPGAGWLPIAEERDMENEVFNLPNVRKAAKRWVSMLAAMRKEISAT